MVESHVLTCAPQTLSKRMRQRRMYFRAVLHELHRQRLCSAVEPSALPCACTCLRPVGSIPSWQYSSSALVAPSCLCLYVHTGLWLQLDEYPLLSPPRCAVPLSAAFSPASLTSTSATRSVTLACAEWCHYRLLSTGQSPKSPPAAAAAPSAQRREQPLGSLQALTHRILWSTENTLINTVHPSDRPESLAFSRGLLLKLVLF